MANIYTYSAYLASDFNFQNGQANAVIPVAPPTVQLHIRDTASGTAGTQFSNLVSGQTGYVFNNTTGTYTVSATGPAVLAGTQVWTIDSGPNTGQQITVYFFDINNAIYAVISQADQAAYANATISTNPAVFNQSTLNYDAIPSWGETIIGANGGPPLGGADAMYGLDGDDSLRGLSGNDTIDGGAGNDSLLGGEDNDTVLGGDGDDILYGDGSDVRDPGQDASSFIFNRANVDASDTADNGAGTEQVGESIVYQSVATTANGVVVDARLTLVALRDANGNPSSIPVDLNNSNLADPNIVVLNVGSTSLNASNPLLANGGHRAVIRVDFINAATGEPIALNGTFVFRDLDETDITNDPAIADKERLIVATSEFTSYTISTNSSVQVDDTDPNRFTFSGTRPNDQNTLTPAQQEQNQVALDFVNRESFTVTFVSRRVNSGFTFDTANFTTATIVGDASDEGDDLILGGAGNDTLFGSSGNDTLDGGTGNDLIDAGNDSDLILLTDGFGADTIRGAEGGTDMDTLSAIGLSSNGVDITILDYLAGNFTGTAREATTTDITEFSEIERIVLSNNNDTFDASGITGAVTVEGLGGDDSILGGAGNDTIYGGAANTTAAGAAGAGNDTISDGAGNDFVYGGSGNDLLIVGSGADRIDGQDGNDTFRLTDDFGTDTLIGGLGNDTIDASQLNAHGIDVVFTGNDDGTISDQTNTAGVFTSIRNVVFSDQADSVDASAITSNLRDHDLAGGDDSYNASGSTGRRTVIGGAGNDTIIAGTNNDSLDGGADDDALTGNAGNDTLIGGTGNDTLYGGVGADLLNGGDGEDVFLLEERDTALGGLGNDRFQFTPSASNGLGTDTISITGGEDPGDGDVDTLSLAGLINTAGNQLTRADITFTPGDPEAGSFTLQDGTFVTFTEIERVICFDAKAHIMTPTGGRPAGLLKLGDLVVTRDNGLQPIRWIGRRSVPATGLLAPITFDAGALGHNKALRVSPQHRMLVRDVAFRLKYGVDEMLIAAKHLVNGHSIRQISGGTIDYVHIMLDRHAILFAEGIESESFHPGEMGSNAIDPAARAELFSIFPQLAVNGPNAYGSSARQTLRACDLPQQFLKSA